MTIAAAISAAELSSQVSDRFDGSYFEALLVNLPGTTYDPSVPGIDATFLAAEISSTGGYARQGFNYVTADINGYADDGIGLSTKAAVFNHDGSPNNMVFTHCVLVWATGSALTLSVGSDGTNLVDGTYQNIPTSGGTGSGLTVDLTISGGATTVVTPSKAGRGYTDADTITVSSADLEAAGAATAGGSAIGVIVDSTYSDPKSGSIFSVAQTSNQVALSSGNQAVFYFNLKQFGYYSV